MNHCIAGKGYAGGADRTAANGMSRLRHPPETLSELSKTEVSENILERR
jgi:hypothetical protein